MVNLLGRLFRRNPATYQNKVDTIAAERGGYSHLDERWCVCDGSTGSSTYSAYPSHPCTCDGSCGKCWSPTAAGLLLAGQPIRHVYCTTGGDGLVREMGTGRVLQRAPDGGYEYAPDEVTP